MPVVPAPPWLSPVKRLIRKADGPIHQQVMGSNPIGGFSFFVYDHIESDPERPPILCIISDPERPRHPRPGYHLRSSETAPSALHPRNTLYTLSLKIPSV